MTREIKFRAWDNKNKLFITNDEYMIGLDGKFYRMDFYSGISGYEDGNLIWNELKDIILMQYTGLKDKNGKEMYEGDIVKIMQETKTFFDKVIYDNHLCSFRFEGLSDYCDFCDWLREGAEFEVVSNIYENPELIGGEND